MLQKFEPEGCVKTLEAHATFDPLFGTSLTYWKANGIQAKVEGNEETPLAVAVLVDLLRGLADGVGVGQLRMENSSIQSSFLGVFQIGSFRHKLICKLSKLPHE